MVRLTTHTRSVLFLALFLVAFAAFFYTALAQEGANDLRATILSELMNDPRTSGFSEVQIDAMVDVLLQGAEESGLTSGDITGYPQEQNTFVVVESSSGARASSPCESAGLPCLLSEAFGFVGPDSGIAFILGATSMGLVWIFAEMLHRRRMHGQTSGTTSM